MGGARGRSGDVTKGEARSWPVAVDAVIGEVGGRETEGGRPLLLCILKACDV